jgi:hypothetical protein
LLSVPLRKRIIRVLAHLLAKPAKRLRSRILRTARQRQQQRQAQRLARG